MKHKNVKGKIYVRRKLLFRVFRNVLLSFFCKGRLTAFVCLIGGRVCNPRQQHVIDIQSILLPRVTNPPPN